MSRSYKKIPIVKDNGNAKKAAKKAANKKVRQKLKDLNYNIADGKSYRKEADSWNISDFTCRWTKQDAIEYYNKKCTPEFYAHSLLSEEYCKRCVDDFKEKYPTLESFLIVWKQEMLSK